MNYLLFVLLISIFIALSHYVYCYIYESVKICQTYEKYIKYQDTESIEKREPLMELHDT